MRVPIRILRDRGPLSPMQALSYWLCVDPDGPGLSTVEAATALGLEDAANIRVHLHRARKKHETE